MFKKGIQILLILWSIITSFSLYAQDSLAVEDNFEEKMIRFQELFFTAMSEKTIGNYEKSVMSLEKCNFLLPNNVSVLFEMSKNYYLLDNLEQAELYVQESLILEPRNIWLLEHLVEVYKKQFNYKDAISVQKKIININIKKQDQLVRLYYLSGDYNSAISLMNEMNEQGILTKSLRNLQENLITREKPKKDNKTTDYVVDLIKIYEKTKSYANLKNLLDNVNLDQFTFKKYAKEALELYPAQPQSYLYYAQALFIETNYSKAIFTLESGMDFVFNDVMKKKYYVWFIKVYSEINQTEKIREYQSKLDDLKS